MIPRRSADEAIAAKKEPQFRVLVLADPDPRRGSDISRWPLGGFRNHHRLVTSQVQTVLPAIDVECLTQHGRASGQATRVVLAAVHLHQLNAPHRLEGADQYGTAKV